MRDELDDHPKDYRSLTYEDWCNLLSTIKVKYERKRSAVHIKKISSSRSASLSDSNESVRIPRRKKVKNGVSNSNKPPRRAHDRRNGAHSYCVLWKKSGMHERKYESHSNKDYTGVRTKLSIKDGIGGSIWSRTHAVQQYKKSENKWNKELKPLKKQKNMIYIIAKKSYLHRETKTIKKIKSEASKKTSISSSEDWSSDSSLARNSIWDKHRRPAWRKEINKLDHVMTNNLKNYNE